VADANAYRQMMAEQLAGRNALYGILDDPASYRTQLANALYSPVTPDSRDGRTPQSYGILSNPAPRAADWAVRSGAADAISPTMGAQWLQHPSWWVRA
jgi:hypothetical protein